MLLQILCSSAYTVSIIGYKYIIIAGILLLIIIPPELVLNSGSFFSQLILDHTSFVGSIVGIIQPFHSIPFHLSCPLFLLPFHSFHSIPVYSSIPSIPILLSIWSLPLLHFIYYDILCIPFLLLFCCQRPRRSRGLPFCHVSIGCFFIYLRSSVFSSFHSIPFLHSFLPLFHSFFDSSFLHSFHSSFHSLPSSFSPQSSDIYSLFKPYNIYK